MAEESLGKARLDLEANLDPLVANMQAGKRETSSMGDTFKALAAAADAAAHVLNQVKLSPGQAAESEGIASSIIEGVRGIGDEAKTAARHLDDVKLGAEQAAETRANADAEVESLKKVERQAIVTREAIKHSGGSSVGGTTVGILGAAIGAGALTAPAAGPAVLGLLGAVPVLAGAGAGSLGVLALAFDGVTKAIGGNKKAFDDLGPAAQQFTLTVRSLNGWFDKLRQTAASNMFPGLTEALHSALSPGTVNAVTAAIAEFARAIGQAGAAWGKYFGSPEFQSLFGPLMQAGARNLSTLSTAALSLTDAIGVLARAAIPFTTWLLTSTAAGARWLDTFLHARDATGQLAGAMREAQTSLQLVAGLAASLVRAVGALGAALYPVSKVAVKDLTNGLNALAGIIDRNRQTIRDIVGGALSALVQTIKVAVPIVRALFDAAKSVAEQVGGWKTAFEIVIGGLLVAKLSALISPLLSVGKAILGIGAEATAAAGAISGMQLALARFAAVAAVPIIVHEIITQTGLGKWAGGPDITPDHLTPGNPYPQGSSDWTNFQAGMNGTKVSAASQGTAAYKAGAKAASKAGTTAPASGTYSASQLAALWIQAGGDPSVAPLMAQVAMSESSGRSGIVNSIGATGLWQIHPGGSQYKDPLANARAAVAKYDARGLEPWDASKAAWSKTSAYQQYLGASPGLFTSNPPFTTNLGPKGPSAATLLAQSLQVPVTKDQTLAAHFKALAAAANTGPMIAKYLDDEAAALAKENIDLTRSMQGKTAEQKAKIAGTIQKNVDEIAKLHAQMVQAISMGADASAFARFQAALAAVMAKFKADSAYATVLTGDAADRYRAVLRGDLDSQAAMLTVEKTKLEAKLASATGKTRSQLQAELAKVTTQLSDVQGQVLGSLEATVQTLQSKVGAAFQSVVAEMDAQFEAKTQAMLDAAAAEFFQGGLQTPLERQLAGMQAQDQLQSLQDAVTAAADDKTRAAAQRQLDEYELGIRAAAERAQADENYAAETKRIQAQRTAVETAMNKQLALLGDAFDNGTGSMTDLTAIADEYGVQVSTVTIPDFQTLSGASVGLIAAFQALADYIAKITGTPPVTLPGAPSTPPTGPSGLGRIPSPGGRIPLASGGIVLPRQGGTPALLAEAGVPEAVIPLPALAGGGDIVLMVGEVELGRISANALRRDTTAARVTAKAVQPHFSRITSVSK